MAEKTENENVSGQGDAGAVLNERRDEPSDCQCSADSSAEGELALRARSILLAQLDPARFLSILEPLKLGRVQVVAAAEDLGVLVRFKREGAFFAAPFGEEAARAMAGMLPVEALVSLPDDRYRPLFTGGAEVDAGRYELWVYEGGPSGGERDDSERLQSLAPEGFTIRPLGPDDFDVVRARYRLLSSEGIRDHLERGWIRGGYDANGTLVGFIGEHDEASMGMLEVFPETRRRGYAQALEASLIASFKETGRVPYCHVALDNEASKALQRKLGLRRVDTIQSWFGLPPKE